MNPPAAQTDYLIIGAGATALAFADTLLSENPDASMLIVDRQDRVGGHWNHAYPWVRVHQPSAYYGVASRELSNGLKDETGLNAGQYTLATGAEVLAHFDGVMRERLLPSGRVQWRPMSEVARGADGIYRITSLVNGQVQTVTVRRKTVDATHARTEVPATHAPRYTVAPGVTCVPLNRLPEITRPYAAYTVVGSGKTGIDACLWLLAHGVASSRIRWVMPRDAWFIDRGNVQPGLENFERTTAYAINQFDAIAESNSIPELFARLESSGALLRLDPRVEPSTYRCCTVSRGELARLRQIENVVRLGRLQAIEPARMQLAEGSTEADPDTLYIDCSASAIQPPPGLPVFDGDRINLFMVRTCQPTFSAALIAYVEAHVEEAAYQNALCAVVPSPEHPIDWLRMWAVTLANGARWRQHAGLNAWVSTCRLNAQAVFARGVTANDAARLELLKAVGTRAAAAASKLPALLAQAGRATASPR